MVKKNETLEKQNLRKNGKQQKKLFKLNIKTKLRNRKNV